MAERQGGEPECPVCWDPFNNTFHTPKVLACCHSFCLECLAHLRLVTPARHHGLLCPVCRQPTALASGQPVTDLPTDNALLTQLCLQPLRVILEGHRLSLDGRPESRGSLRQLQVCTPPDLDAEPGSRAEGPQAVAPAATGPSSGTPAFRTLRQCLRDPELPVVAYLMLAIFGASLLSLFVISWARKSLWFVG